jgi:heterodisulfide reductase subunit A
MSELSNSATAQPDDQPQVLIMEDESSVAQGLKLVLKDEGYNVEWAMTGQSALDNLGTKDFDLLVADLRLPDMDGMKVIEHVTHRKPNTKIVVITGYATIPSAVEAMKLGVIDYLPKPFTEDEFISRVKNILKAKPKDRPQKEGPVPEEDDMEMHRAREATQAVEVDMPQILIMEDEPSVALGLQMVLSEEGYNVQWSKTGQLALDSLRQKKFDLMVADLRLPDMDGMEVVKYVKNEKTGTPVIIITGYASVASSLEAMKTGVVDYLSKPFTEEEFMASVVRAFKNKPASRPHKEPAPVDLEISRPIKIGLYICHCGTDIPAKVSIEEVVRFVEKQPNVVVARDHVYMCQKSGQTLIEADIKKFGINRVVVAACSPEPYEKMFQEVCRRAGLGADHLQMISLREQVAWVTQTRSEATMKAKSLAAASIHRIKYRHLIAPWEVSVHPDILIVGGGIAGMQAAITAADAGFQVHLVEREPSIGGNMSKFDKTFPTLDCAACIMTPKMVTVGQHENIQLYTYSEVISVDGFVGNYKAKILKKPRYVDENKCTGCGTCMQKCPVKKVPSEFNEGLSYRSAIFSPFPYAVPKTPVIDPNHCRVLAASKRCGACEKFCDAGAIDLDQVEQIIEIQVGSIILATGFEIMDPTPLKGFGYGKYPNVFTGLEFERINNATGPTEGQILLRSQDGDFTSPPESVAILHCIGSRDINYHEYCSRVCCMYALKYGHLIKDKVGRHVKIYNFYMDLRCYGKGYEEFYRRCQEKGIFFIRGKPSEITTKAKTPEEQGKMIVVSEDTLSNRMYRIPVDMAILCTAMEARADAAQLSNIFGIDRGEEGFFSERHAKLSPTSSTKEGIFLAGACQGPKDIPETVGHARGAAAQAIELALRGSVVIPKTVAWIDQDTCEGCSTCLELCAHGAIEFDIRRRVSVVNQARCVGCGICVSACPNGAAHIWQFNERRINTEMDGIVPEHLAIAV